MKNVLIASGLILGSLASGANAQVELKTYTDKDGFLDVQALTCAQLAGTFQQDADLLTTWYSGWYNGLAKKHYFNIARSKELEHEVIGYCKAHPEVRIIEAIDVMLKQEKHQAVFK